jgi:type I restriction enzyme S subunit
VSEGSWPIVALGELIESIEAGSSFRCRETPPEEGEVGVAKVSAVSWGRYDECESKTCLDPSRISEELLIRKGDFLISRANTVELVGACVIAEQVSKKVMLSDKTLRIQFKDSSLKPWVLHFLRSRAGRQQIEALCTGNQESMRNISQRSLRQIELPLAPPEQRQEILAFVDQQLSRADATTSTLQVIQAKLKQTRASILKAAVEGRLVGVEAELDAENSGDVEVLPPEWYLSQLGSICTVTGGVTKNSSINKDGVSMPYLRVANVYANRLDLDEIKTITLPAASIPKYRLEKGDLLIVEGNGSADQLGRVAIWDGSIENCVHQNHLIKARPKTPSLSKYLLVYLNSVHGRNQIKQVASSTSGLHTLSISKVQRLQILVPPPDQRRIIIAEVERRFSVLDQVEATVNASLRRCGQLRQAVLKKAFGG